VKRLAVLLLAVAATAAILAPGSPGATTVNVSGKEFSFSLSKRTVSPGSVTFRFTNRGSARHDFKIAGRKTPVLRPGKSASVRATLRAGRRYTYVCTVPGHRAAGMRGTLRVR
jgi:plastocyanin